MQRLLVVGCFGDKTGRLDGQIVKTNSVINMLKRRIGNEAYIDMFNTLSIRYNVLYIIKLFFKLIFCSKVVIIPAHRNLAIFFPFAYYFSFVARYKIVLICVGGWQVDFFLGSDKWKEHKRAMNLSRKCYAFLPELKRVNEELRTNCGFTNCEVFPNFRNFIFSKQFKINNSKKLKLVYLGRINKNKGYNTIFRSVDFLLNKGYDISITFYGSISSEDESDFKSLLSINSDFVTYGGIVLPDTITQVLCNYDVMLFPTQYYTEGFPGTVLDSFIAGIPIIATEWMHSHEFIKDRVNGFIVPFDNPQNEFNKCIEILYNDREMLFKMKEESHASSIYFTEDSAWKILSKYLI